MPPSKHSSSLYFTPRTPWGRLPQNRPGQSQNYLRASEDAPLQPIQKRPNFLQRAGSSIANGVTGITHGIASGAKGLGHAIGNVHPFGGLEVEKNQGEKPSFGAVAGVRLGNGPSSTGEDTRGEDRDWALERMHLGEPSEQAALQKTADEKRKRRQEYEDQRRKAQKETDHYVNTVLSAVDDTAAYFKLPQGQSKPAR